MKTTTIKTLLLLVGLAATRPAHSQEVVNGKRPTAEEYSDEATCPSGYARWGLCPGGMDLVAMAQEKSGYVFGKGQC